MLTKTKNYWVPATLVPVAMMVLEYAILVGEDELKKFSDRMLLLNQEREDFQNTRFQLGRFKRTLSAIKAKKALSGVQKSVLLGLLEAEQTKAHSSASRMSERAWYSYMPEAQRDADMAAKKSEDIDKLIESLSKS